MIKKQSKFLIILLYVFSGYWLYVNFPENNYKEYVAHFDHEKKYPESTLNITLQPFKKYSLYMDIEMPDSEINRDIGLYSVQIDMESNNLKLSEKRTFLLEYYSNLVRNIHDVFKSPLFLLSKWKYNQKLSQNFFTSLEVNDSYLKISIKILQKKIQYYNVIIKLVKDNQTYFDKIVYFLTVVLYMLFTIAVGGFVLFYTGDVKMFEDF